MLLKATPGEPPGFRQILELFTVEQLIPQSAEERLRISRPVASACLRISFAMNSGPLSLRMCFGTPRLINKLTNTSTILSAVMLRSTSNARHSRVYSSVIANHFKGLPDAVLS